MRARNYILLFILGVVPAAAMLILVGVESGASELIPVAPLPLLIPSIAMMVFIYKMWAAIQDGQTKPTAGMALGLLMVPIVNMFWLPTAIGSWPHKAVAFAERTGRPVPKVGRGAFTTFVALIYIIPVIFGIALFLGEVVRAFLPAQILLVSCMALYIFELVLYFVIIVRVCRTVTQLKGA